MLRIFVLSIGFSLSADEPKSSATNYRVLDTTNATSNNQIILYCWLGSESCSVLETALSEWAANNAITLLNKPVIKRPHWRRLAKARLVAQLMGVENELNQVIQKHLFQDKLTFENDEALFKLLEDNQISASRFANIFYAAETNQAINQIQEEAKQHQVRGIPTVVVNNQWLIDTSMQSTSRAMIETIQQLLGMSGNGE